MPGRLSRVPTPTRGADVAQARRTRLRWLEVPTDRLGTVRFLVAGSQDGGVRSTVPAARWVWVLHGRGSSAAEVRPVVESIAAAACAGILPPCVVVAPDGPWSRRMSWWVDSSYTGTAGGPPPGFPVETGLLTEALPWVERVVGDGLPKSGAVVGRTVVGLSMGGSVALRWLLRPDRLFDSALLLSPAVYRAEPPFASSARTSGAFGRGGEVFDAVTFAALAGWESLLDAAAGVAGWPGDLAGDRAGERAGYGLGRLSPRLRPRARLRVVTLIGDGELAQDGPSRRASPGRASDEVGGRVKPDAGAVPYDLDLQAARLHAALRRRPDIDAHLRIVGGGHDVDFWAATVVDGLRLTLAGLDVPSEREPGERGPSTRLTAGLNPPRGARPTGV